MADRCDSLVDRGRLATEQRLPEAAALDAMSIEQTLRLMNTQDLRVPLAVGKALPAITKLTEAVTAALKSGGRLIYVGAGTSGRLGVLDASECPPTFFTDPGQVVGVIAGADAALRRSAEGREDEPAAGKADVEKLGVTKNDVVVGIAAGGSTPYVWGALQAAREHAAATAMICCVPLESLRQRRCGPVVAANESINVSPAAALPVEVDYTVELPVGGEVVTGSTRLKAGTATKLVLNMITTATMVQLGKTWGNLMVDLRATNAKLRDRAVRILSEQCSLDRQAAGRLLDQAGGRVKVALVMARLQVDAAQAQHRLEETNGRLRPLIGAPR